MYTAEQIADWILGKVDTEKGDTISPLKLQKLLYYCQAWTYTIFNEKLFDEKIEAWAHGPVVPSQYKRFKDTIAYSNIDITKTCIKTVVLRDKKIEDLLNEVMDIYGEHSASYLENLSHSEKPWKETRGNLPSHERCNKEIRLNVMKEYYSSINNCDGQKEE